MSDPNNIDQPLIDALRLNLVSGIGPRLRHLLVNRFGSPAAVFKASQSELQSVQGVGAKLANAITNGPSDVTARAELERCREIGADVLSADEERYPSTLREIHDAPAVMYYRGTIEPADQIAVALVGSRKCTLYGRQIAERLASGLAKAGVTVISGLARGIDGAAHRGAIDAGGRTFAVMATGLATIYPPEHRDLADEVAGNGALITECVLDQAPVAGLFPQRNRIISGLSMGVVIVEAARRSGALHTARHAMEQGREVFAVPGRIDNPSCEGCLDLLRDGAKLVRSVDDILEELGPLTAPVAVSETEEVHVPRELNLSDQQKSILNLITTDPQHIDVILRNSEIESSRTLSTLTILEMKRLIQRLPGGYLVRRAH